MKNFIFETAINIWSVSSELQTRIELWKKGNIQTVYLTIDDGRGATWQSSVCPIDVRVNPANEPLQNAVYQIRNSGMQVFLVFNIIGIVLPGFSIRPEFYSLNTLHYNMFHNPFVTWRASYIKECLEQVDCDGVALDYIRVVDEPPIGDPRTKEELVRNAIGQFRSVIPSHLHLQTISNSIYTNLQHQGINFKQWLEDRLIDSVMLFNYNDPFPFQTLSGLNPARTSILISSFNSINNIAVSRSRKEVERIARDLARKFNPKGLGLFTANMFTQEQADAISQTHLLEQR